MTKRLLAVFLCVLMLISVLPMAANAAEYTDAQGHWAKSEINKWSDLGILKGNNGSFRPDDCITRAEMAVILDNIMKYQVKAQNTFSDLGKSWYTAAILRANKAEVIMGSSGKVRPNDNITREEAAVMISRALGLAQSEKGASNLKDYKNISLWARGYVNAMVDKGYMSGVKGNFKPQQYITRAEVVKTLDNSINIIYSKAQEYTGNIKGNAVINASGVILKDVTISGNLIIAEGVGKGEVTLDNVKVQGNTIIRGGGPNSVNVKGDSELGTVTVCKKDDGTVSVKVTGNAKVDYVVAEDGSVEVRGAISTLNVTGDVVVKTVGATINSVNIEGAGATVTVDNTSKVETLSVAKEAEKSAVNVEGTVTKVQTAAPQTDLKVSGTVKEISAAPTAKDTKLNVSTAAKVESLLVDAKISVDNKGTINKAEVKADGVTIDGTKPAQTVVDSTVKQKPTDSKGAAIPDTASASAGSVPTPSAGGIPSGGGAPSGGTSGGTPNGGNTGNTGPVTPPVTPPIIPTPVSIASASAINSRVLFVNLSQAAVAVTTSAIAVKDASGAAIKVNSAYLAGWDKTNKTLVVELDKDTTASAIYTVSSGSTSASFNGGAIDTVKPTIAFADIKPRNYNHIEMKFSEPIKLETLDIEICKVYGSKVILPVLSKSYKNGDPTSVILTTDEPEGAVLYTASLKGISDFAGNVINDYSSNFASVFRNTTIPKALACANNEAGKLVIKFNTALNEETIKTENFHITEKYGISSPCAITEARLAREGDLDEIGAAISKNDASKYVILTIPPLKELTAYKVWAEKLISADDVALSTAEADSSSAFIGKGIKIDKFTFAPTAIDIGDHTSIKINFASRLNKTLAENISNYSIEEAYGGKALAISNAELQPNGTDVKLTVDKMSYVTYKLTVSNIKDEENRTFDNDGISNVTMFRDLTQTAISNIKAVAYNKVEIAFFKKINLDIFNISLYEKYNSYNLKIYKADYKTGDTNTVVLTTDTMKDATLYGLTIIRGEDILGNSIDGLQYTFVGTTAHSDSLKILGSNMGTEGSVIIKFNEDVDETTVRPGNFTLKEKYGAKAPISIKSARMAVEGDLDETGAAVTAENKAKYVILSVGEAKELTTYEITANSVQSAYGKALSDVYGDASSVFVGKGIAANEFTYAPTAVTVASNTAITVSFTSQLDKISAENILNYTIKEVYGNKANLAISSVVLQPDNRSVLLNVSSMNNAIYKIMSSNLSDTENRLLNSDSDANVTTFTGQGTSASAITLITRQGVSDPDTQICVTFNENLSASAIDISHYSISRSIVSKAEFVSGDQNKIILTIGLTSSGAIYTLTTDNLENTGGVPMNLSLSFPGYSSILPYPSIDAVQAIDNRTLRLYFNYNVEGYNIKGKVYNGNSLVPGVLQYKLSGGEYADLADLNEYVYLDPDAENCLLVRTDTEAFRKSSTEAGTFFLKSVNSDIVKNTNEITFDGNINNPVNPAIIGVIAGSNNSLEVFCNSAVADIPLNSISINTKADGTGDSLTIDGIYRVSPDRFKIVVGGMSNINYYLRIVSNDSGDTDTLINNVTDASTFVCMEGNMTSTTTADYFTIQFNGLGGPATKIDNISCMMPDKRTINVYFPEKMKSGDPSAANDVTNPLNYRVYKDSSGSEETAFQPKAATYDSENNYVTLYFNSDIIGPNYMLYLGVKSSIQNFAQTKTVKDSKTGLKTISSGIVFEFYISYSLPTCPKIKEAYISDDNKKMFVKFYTPVAFGNPTETINYKTGMTEVANNEFAVDGFTGIFSSSPLNFDTYFEMEGTDIDGITVTAPALVVRKDNETIELTFAKPFKSLSDGFIRIKTSASTTDAIYTMTGTTPDPNNSYNSLPFVANKITPIAPTSPDMTTPTAPAPTIPTASAPTAPTAITSASAISQDKIVVEFKDSVKDSVSDVSRYTIDTAIGYPSKAEAADSVGDNVIVFKIGEQINPAQESLATDGTTTASDGTTATINVEAPAQ